MTTDVIRLGYAPRAAFIPFHKRRQRWASLVCHRRAGKTVACVADLVDAALRLKKPNPRFAYIAPYYSQAKDVAWLYVKDMARCIPGVDINESELRVDFPNGARVRLYGADNPDRLRGLFLDGVVLDEYADMAPGAFRSVIRPALSDREGWCTFIGTPKGRNEFYEVHTAAELSPEEWYSLTLRADKSGIIAESELADAQKQMTPEQYAQEYLCSFDAAITGAYYGKSIAEAEHGQRICEVPIVPGVVIQTAWDLGIGDSTAIWVFQCVGNEIRILDCFENSGHGLEWYVEALDRRGWLRGDELSRHWLPHDAKVRELTTGRSRVEFLQSLGLKVDLVPNLGLEDGINAGRLMLPQCWFSKGKTDEGVEALRQYRADYDEKKKVFTDRPRHDWTSHYADAFRYLCIAARQLAGPPKDKPKPPAGIPLPDLTMDQFMEIEDRPAYRERI